MDKKQAIEIAELLHDFYVGKSEKPVILVDGKDLFELFDAIRVQGPLKNGEKIDYPLFSMLDKDNAVKTILEICSKL
ncbi:MAG: hypothetical protein IKU77_06200 [Alistipes sp.]|nr:hypothetical protein [Alistipes sp.]